MLQREHTDIRVSGTFHKARYSAILTEFNIICTYINCIETGHKIGNRKQKK